VRDYLEIRFGVMAAHRTTNEFLHDLLDPADSLLATHRELLADFLQSCDLAKFGGWQLRAENMEAMLQSARRFVIESVQPELTKTPHIEPSIDVSREIYDSVPTT
jgi:hypothetical protein